jgi:hypothetical protein
MPSWRPDTAQQRLWLGANRYSSGRRNPGTNTKCLAYSCIKRYPLRGYESDSDANCDGNTHRDGHGYGYSNAHAQVWADTEASSDTAAQTVTVFAKANIVASGDRLMSDRS